MTTCTCVTVMILTPAISSVDEIDQAAFDSTFLQTIQSPERSGACQKGVNGLYGLVRDSSFRPSTTITCCTVLIQDALTLTSADSKPVDYGSAFFAPDP